MGKSEQELEDEARARKFIAKHKWKFAKTMPHIPHSYVVKDYLMDEDKEEFAWFVERIQKYGIRLAWGKYKPKPYWFIDEYKYWVMEEDISTTTLVNRGAHDL